MDGSETICLGEQLGAPCRAYVKPDMPVIEELRQLGKTLLEDSRPKDEILGIWHQEVCNLVGWADAERNVWFLGQDAAFAAPLA